MLLALCLALVAPAAGACGDDSGDAPGATSTTEGTAGTTSTSTSSPAASELGQPAIWPAPDVAFDTPEAAAQDFVQKVLGVPPVISDFRQGDARSGEIEVYSAGEGGDRRILRGTLLLRRLGADDGWFIIGAANTNATIERPTSGATVSVGSVEVSGRARGFEANVVVSAFAAGRAGTAFDEEITQGGSMETPEPYTVSLDLSSAPAGSTVVLLVRGGTGLETDPGDFGAIPVVMATS